MSEPHPRNPPPTGSRLALVLLGAFFTFAPMGILLQMVAQPPGTWVGGVVGGSISGLIAAGYASVFMHRRYILIVPLFLGSMIVPAVVFWSLAQTDIMSIGSGLSPRGRLIVLALMVLASIIAGYFFIVRYTEFQERDATRSRTELELASGIHKTLVPAIDLSTQMVQIVGRSLPSSQMGGDLIDVVCEDGRIDVYLADVSGHGVKAGIVMAMVKAGIRMRLRSGLEVEGLELGGLLEDLDAVLQQTIEPGMFATFACMRFVIGDAASAGEVRASFALAGHLPILHYSAETRQVVDLPNDALPLGVGDGEIYSEQGHVCRPGDTFVLLTDGLTEVMDASGRQFGLAGVRAHLAARGDDQVHDLHRSLLESARSHGKQIDDQTLLIVRVRS